MSRDATTSHRLRTAWFTIAAATVVHVSGCTTGSPGAGIQPNEASRSAIAVGVETREIEYADGDTICRGLLAWPTNAEGPVPGVVVVHQWRGRGEHERQRAEMLAELGYAAFALDMYGGGVFEAEPTQAARRSGAMLADRDALTRRFVAGWEAMKSQPEVDAARTAAIGYCFGGTVVLEVARRGVPLDAVTSFHGTLMFANTPEEGSVHADILVCNGHLDPLVPREMADTFMQQLSAAGADWTFVDYGGAVHAFTDPGAGPFRHGARAAHDPRADARSWAAMTAQFHDRLGVPAAGAHHHATQEQDQ